MKNVASMALYGRGEEGHLTGNQASTVYEDRWKHHDVVWAIV